VGQPSYQGQEDYGNKSGLHAALNVHDYMVMGIVQLRLV
jgi:hypothetical protein